MNKIAVVSGGFDPAHIGHLRMFQEAAKYGTLIVGLNSDEWLMRKKGFVFMPWLERQEIIMGFKGVDAVLAFDDSDNTCIDLLKKCKELEADGWTDIVFCNGGDRTDETTPEVEFCNKNDIGLVWGVGGSKIQSSSKLVEGNK